MALQLVIAKGEMNVLSTYTPQTMNVLSMCTPQTECTDEDKDTFWKKLDDILHSIPANGRMILAGDKNGHVGADRSGVAR